MFSRRTVAGLLIIFAVIIQSASAQDNPVCPDDVAAVLDSAGNRAELEKVLMHYQSDTDTLKYKSACYLIANMEGHCYATYALKDTLENEHELNVLAYPSFDSLLVELDSMEAKYGTLDFGRKDLIYDKDVITAVFLINQIDYAFRAWRERPWAKRLTYEQFRDYILPYRGSNEPLEDWRQYFWEKYDSIESFMTNPEDPIEAASIINDSVMSWFKFDSRYYLHPTDQGLSEMLDNKLGRCEDMTNLTIYAMRANGLAVTSDYTPHWANAGNNHAWNSIVDAEGRVIPFMGAESNPGKYALQYKLAKVYRKMYGNQKDNLIFQERKQEKVPGWLAGKSYIDVTAAYIDVCDVPITLKNEISDSVDIAYLCVFNDNYWRAINWGRIENGISLFPDMGTGIAYISALYINEKIEPCGPPLILHDDCSMENLAADSSQMISITVVSTTQVKQDTSTEGVEVTHLNPNKEYELFFWADGWQSLGKKMAGDTPLVFENVPGGALYRLVEEGSDNEERIFTYGDGRQIWW
ncbi:MAG: transglutaminase-like domain-containing protein [Candidatus Zixiibacteriota bacterium]